MMDDNRHPGWMDVQSEHVPELWLGPGTGTDNAPSIERVETLGEPKPPVSHGAAPESAVLRLPYHADNSSRIVYFLACGLGMILAMVAVYLATRALPRFSVVQMRYGFDLPIETRWALRSGMLQPMPACALLLAGLTGLLARAPSRRHAIVTAILLLLAIALPVATATALLLPELTLV